MRLLFIILFLLKLDILTAQTVTIPDTNLRNKLLVSYPAVMEGDELNLANAAALTGTLDLRNSNIIDATGIEYFTSITTLDLSFNQLTTLPSISNTTGLIHFYANNNQLITLPDMSALIQLHDFQVMKNQLTQLPGLPINNLRSIYCSANQLTSFPSLTNASFLQNLVIGENPFQEIIDFSHCTELLQLHIHKTGFDKVLGLANLSKLTVFYAWSNSIKDLSALDSITTLTHCVIYDNPIKKLPYIANKPNLSILTVVHCLLTFEDILPVIDAGAPSDFIYSPQRSIPYQDIIARAENNFSISYPVKAPHASNFYAWYKNDVFLDSSASPIYSFTPLNFSDSGNYVLKIYNSQLPSLILETKVFGIQVLPCIEFDLPVVKIINQECGTGYTIDLSNAKIYGGTPPFSYELTTTGLNKIYDDPYIEKLPAGNYHIKIIDAKKCNDSDQFTLNRIEKCDPVITPDGDGIADTYFIQNTGKVNIFNLRRQLVKTLDAPTVWDGTDQSGVLLDAGYYIILAENEKPIYITLIR